MDRSDMFHAVNILGMSIIKTRFKLCDVVLVSKNYVNEKCH